MEEEQLLEVPIGLTLNEEDFSLSLSLLFFFVEQQTSKCLKQIESKKNTTHKQALIALWFKNEHKKNG